MTNGHEDNGLLITSMDDFVLLDNSHIYTTGEINNDNKIQILQNIRKVSTFNFDFFLPVLKDLNADINEHLVKNGTYGYIVKYSDNFISLIFQSSAIDFVNKFKNVNDIFNQDEEWQSFKEIQNLQKKHNIDFKIWSKGSVFNIEKDKISERKLYTNYNTLTMIINIYE